MWHTNEKGQLSPWDIFQIDPDRLPKRKENGVLVTREDMLKINYKPSFNEWPEVYDKEMDSWRCYESKRIYNAIKFIEKNLSEHIVSIFKECHNSEIAYPVNLQLIKERLKNLFYRRKEAIIRDITFLKTNAKLYVKKSDFKNCEEFVDLLLSVANDCQSIKVEHFDAHLNKFPLLKEDTPDLPQESPSMSSSCDTNSTNSSSNDCPVYSSSSAPKFADQTKPISSKKVDFFIV